jgi:hypothetical protein
MSSCARINSNHFENVWINRRGHCSFRPAQATGSAANHCGPHLPWVDPLSPAPTCCATRPTRRPRQTPPPRVTAAPSSPLPFLHSTPWIGPPFSLVNAWCVEPHFFSPFPVSALAWSHRPPPLQFLPRDGFSSTLERSSASPRAGGPISPTTSTRCRPAHLDLGKPSPLLPPLWWAPSSAHPKLPWVFASGSSLVCGTVGAPIHRRWSPQCLCHHQVPLCRPPFTPHCQTDVWWAPGQLSLPGVEPFPF